MSAPAQFPVKPARPAALLDRALRLHRNGDLHGACDGYKALLQAYPNHSDALHLLGLGTAALGRPEAGMALIRRALEVQPRFPAAWFNLGNVCHQTGRLTEAIDAFRQAHQLQPNNADVLCNLANCLVLTAQYPEAEAVARNAIALAPGNPMLHLNLGLTLAQQGRLADAVESFRTSLAVDANIGAAWEELGTVLHTLGRQAEAVPAFEQALRLNPGNAVIWCELGECLASLAHPAEAHAALDRAIACNSRLVAAHLHKGSLLQRENRLGDALRCYLTAAEIDPRCGEALSNIGTIHLAKGDLDAAELTFRRVQTVAPEHKEAAWNLAVTLLTRGNYTEGWPAYEHRWALPYLAKTKREYPCPLWTGQQAIEGRTVLVYAEQGFGDTLQFARYIPVLARAGAAVHFHVQPALLRLLQQLEGAASVAPLGDTAPPSDYHIPLLSLPAAFGTTQESIPHPAGYLRAPPDTVAKWTDKVSVLPGRKIGIAWSGNRSHNNDHNRSIPLAVFQRLFEVENSSFVVLQKDQAPVDDPMLASFANVHDHRAAITDFADTAAIITHLDLVIAVDTSVAHLSAALGKPTWVLLPFNADWRWMRNRTDSPWYTAARLFRQPTLGDWESVIRLLQQTLGGSGQLRG